MADLAFGGRCDRIAHRCVMMILMTFWFCHQDNPAALELRENCFNRTDECCKDAKFSPEASFHFIVHFQESFSYSLISGDPDRWLQNAQQQCCAPVNWEAMWFQPSVRDAYGGQRDLGVGDRFWRWFWRFHPYFYVFFWQTTRLFTDFFPALFPKVGLYLNFNLTGPAHRASGFLKIISKSNPKST